MKKSEEIRRKTWRMIAKNLIVLAALAVAAVIGVNSWFTKTTEIKAAGLNVQCQLPQNLEIAIMEPGERPESTDWVKSSEILDLNGTNYSFIEPLNMTQVTGDGISFISPYLMQDGTVAIVDEGATWDATKIQTVRNRDYLSFDLYMRTEALNTYKVLLSSDTYFGPVNQSETFANTPDGKINKNSVIGSARLSVLDDTFNARKLLWIPAPHIYFAYDQIWTGITNTNNTYGLAKARTGTSQSDSTLTNIYPNEFNGTYKHVYWTQNKDHQVINRGNDLASNVTANNNQNFKLGTDVNIGVLSKNLSTLSGVSSDGVYKYNVARFNIWLEGEDPEARSAQVGGEYRVTIKLAMMPNTN